MTAHISDSYVICAYIQDYVHLLCQLGMCDTYIDTHIVKKKICLQKYRLQIVFEVYKDDF